MNKNVAVRWFVLAALALAGAGVLSFAAVSARSGGPDATSTPIPTDQSDLSPPAVLPEPADMPTPAPPMEGLPTPAPPAPEADAPAPGCALTVIDAGMSIHKQDSEGRAFVVRTLQTVRNECTGEVLTRDTATGKLAGCATLLTMPAEPAFRILENGEEEFVRFIEVLTDFCTGKSFTRDPETGETWLVRPAPHQDLGPLLDDRLNSLDELDEP